MMQQANTAVTELPDQSVNSIRTTMMSRPALSPLMPQTPGEFKELADIFAKSNMVPKCFQGKPHDIFTAMRMGAELGLLPMQALQNIAVINGRPSLWGDALLAIARTSPKCDYIREYFDTKNNVATCIAKRTDDTEEAVRTFDIEDARRAGLWGRQGPWSQYPKRMLQMRARSWAIRDTFADLLSGFNSAEEQQDCIEKTITPVAKTMVNIGSKAEALLNHLKAQSASESVEISETKADEATISVHSIVDQINEANNEAELMSITEQAKTLSEADQVIARDAYKQKLKTLRGIDHLEQTEAVGDIDETETACDESHANVF